MSSIYEGLAPYLDSLVTGKQAFQKQKASLDREAFDFELQEKRRKIAETDSKRKEQFNQQVDLLRFFSPEQVLSANGGLPSGQTIQERKDAEAIRQWQAEQDATAAYRNSQLGVARERAASSAAQSGNDLKKFQADALTSATFATDPRLSALTYSLADTRAKRQNVLQDLKDAGVNPFDLYSGQVPDSTLPDKSKPLIDSLLTLDQSLGKQMTDSTLEANLIKARLMGLQLQPQIGDTTSLIDEYLDELGQ